MEQQKISIKHKLRGFSLVETIVAIAILSLAMVAPLSLAQKSLNAAMYAKDQVTAFYLAQEAIEYARNIRDNNSLNNLSGGGSWLSGLDNCIYPKMCGIDVTIGSIVDCSSNPNLCKVTFNPTSNVGVYGLQTGGVWKKTSFSRNLQITKAAVGADFNGEADLVATVSWQTGLISKNIQIQEKLFNWFPPPAPVSAPDTIPPLLFSMNASSVTVSSATIGWGTNENADSQVEYGTSLAYGSLTVLNSTLTTNHAIALSGLSPSTTYNFRVKSRDAAGNLAVSGNNTFTTPSSTPPPPTGDYYVDASLGLNSNPGTSALPFQTIQKAVNVAVAGDTIIVRDGTYTYDGNGEKSIVTFSNNRTGNASNRITIRSQNKWGAIIDGQNNSTGAKFGFVIYAGSNYITIQDFDIKNLQNTDGDGAFMVYGNNINLIGNHIHNIGTQVCTSLDRGIIGMFINLSNSQLVDGNRMHDIGRQSVGTNGCGASVPNLDHAIYLAGVADSTFRNNVIYNIPHGWGIHVYNSDGVVKSSNLTIVNNTFAFPNVDRDGQIVLTTPGLNGGVIENNIFYSPRAAGVRITGTMTNVLVKKNITYGGVIASPTGAISGVSYFSNSDNTDPKPVNPTGLDFHIQSSSPAKDAVVDTFGITTDFDGNTRPSGAAADIGAYEF